MWGLLNAKILNCFKTIKKDTHLYYDQGWELLWILRSMLDLDLDLSPCVVCGKLTDNQKTSEILRSIFERREKFRISKLKRLKDSAYNLKVLIVDVENKGLGLWVFNREVSRAGFIEDF